MARAQVNLTSADMAWCRQIAAERNDAKVRAGIGRAGTYDGLASTMEMHLYAVYAELAVSKLTDCGIDTSVTTRGNRLGNLIFHDFRGFARYRGKRGWDLALKTPDMSGFNGDVAFLVWPVMQTALVSVEVVGWISRDQFYEVATVHEYLRGGRRLAVEAGKLHRMSEHITPYWTSPARQVGLF